MSRPKRIDRHGPVALVRLALATLLALAASIAFSGPVHAQELPPGFAESTVLSDLETPSAISFVPGGGILVAEISGVIKHFDGPGDSTSTVVANIEREVHFVGDRGLLGMRLDPQYPTRPYLYVVYTHNAAIGGVAPRWDNNGQSFDGCPHAQVSAGCVVSGRLVRMELSTDETEVVDKKVLVEDWCQQFSSHSMGSIAFDSEGALLASSGEGASFNYSDYGQDPGGNPCGDPPGGVGGTMEPPTAEGGALRSQDVRTLSDPTGLSGSVIRVDPDTGAPLDDNPVIAPSDANAERIVAHGFRNPFRIAVRPGTDELWVGDVGWGQVEEINRIPSVTGSLLNFGWPCFEGAQRRSGYNALNLCSQLALSSVTLPYFQYTHFEEVADGDGCGDQTQFTWSSAISGLAFEDASAFPDAYRDSLFFADYARNCIWTMADTDSDGVPDASAVAVFRRNAATPVDLQFGPDGLLYYVDIATGSVRRIAYNGPSAVAEAVESGSDPLTWELDGRASSDPDDALSSLDFAWDLDGDDGYDDSSATAFTHTFPGPGSYSVGLRVTDPDGNASFDRITVEVANSPPVPLIEAPGSDFRWKVGDQIEFSGSATDEGQSLPASALEWSIAIDHCPADCHQHPGYGRASGVASGTVLAPDHEYPSKLVLTLTATDPFGSQASTAKVIDPRTVDVTLASSPSGLEVTLDSATGPAPLIRPVIVGSSHSIATTSPQGSFNFVNWSDGGALSHQVTIDTEQTLTATFAGPPPPPDPPPPNHPPPVDPAPPVPPPADAMPDSLTPEPLTPPPTQPRDPPLCDTRAATIVGALSDQTLLGTPGRDVIVSFGGSDTIRSGGGKDIVCAGPGPDTVRGQGGRDRLLGGAGDDVIRGGAKRDRIDGGLDDDSCGADPRDTVVGCP